MINPRHITLSELQSLVKSSLAESFPLPVWVVAEIAELKVNYSGHCYIELIEKGESDGVPKAQAKAVIWRTLYPRIAGYFEVQTGQKLAAGLSVLVKATVNYHKLYGFSLQISDIDASYTLGDMERQKLQTIARLKQDGVWDINRQLPMPIALQRIAVVSSRNAAGYQDFINSLNKSGYRFRTRLFDSVMQGNDAEESIISSLYAISDLATEFDAVVIIRGGGSTSDLNCYNSYELASNVAQFPLPIITGIGHDKDISVVDMVAHTSLKTPTAVAMWLIEQLARLDYQLESAARQLLILSQEIISSQRVNLERVTSQIESLSIRHIENCKLGLNLSEERLRELVEQRLSKEQERLDSAQKIIETLSPDRLLKMGFAIVRCEGQMVSDAITLEKGQRVEIEFGTGTRSAIIE